MSGKKLGLDNLYKNLYTTVNKNSPSTEFINRRLKLFSTDEFTNRRMTLSSNKPAKEDTFTNRRKKLKSATKNIFKTAFKRSPIGRIADLTIKVGSGIGIGYNMAKEKFKPDNKMVGGMAENRGMGLQDESMKPGKIMKVKYGKMVKK